MYLVNIITILIIFIKCILSLKLDNIHLSKSQWQNINSLIKNLIIANTEPRIAVNTPPKAAISSGVTYNTP